MTEAMTVSGAARRHPHHTAGSRGSLRWANTLVRIPDVHLGRPRIGSSGDHGPGHRHRQHGLRGDRDRIPAPRGDP